MLRASCPSFGMCVCKKTSARACAGSIGAARPKPLFLLFPFLFPLSWQCRACRAGTSTGAHDCQRTRSQPKHAARSRLSAHSFTAQTPVHCALLLTVACLHAVAASLPGQLRSCWSTSCRVPTKPQSQSHSATCSESSSAACIGAMMATPSLATGNFDFEVSFKSTPLEVFFFLAPSN